MNKQKEKRRQELLSAAAEIINTEGYDACTVRSICSRVGVSASSFYNCFEDKDEVIFCIGGRIDDHFAEIEDRFGSEDPGENMICFLREYLRWVESQGAECCWRIHLSQRNGRHLYHEQTDRVLPRIFNRILYQGKELWYGDLNETEMFDIIMTVLRGKTLAWAQQSGRYPLAESCERELPAMVRMVFRES